MLRTEMMWSWPRQTIERYPVRASALFGLVSVALFLGCFTPLYETNDDVVMMNTASGQAFGQPSEHLIFTNVLIGLVLSVLYRITQQLDWYGLYLYGLHAVGLALLFYAFVARRPTLGGLLLFLLPVAYFEPQLLISVQFTPSAMIVGIGAVVVFLSRADSTEHPRRLALICGLLLGLTALVRYAALPGILALASPLIAANFRRMGMRMMALWLAAAMGLAAGAYAFERVTYHRDPAWGDFFAFNTARGLIHGTPRLHRISEDTLEEIGWSVNDLSMFGNWFFYDPKVFSAEKVETIVQRDQEQTADRLARDGIWAPVKEAWGTHRRWLVMPVAFLAAALPLIGRRGKLLALATSAVAVVVLAALVTFGHLPQRVAVPAAMVWTLLLALTVYREAIPWATHRPPFLSACCVLSVLMMLGSPKYPTLGEMRKLSREHERLHAVLHAQFETMQRTDPEGFFFLRGSSLYLEAQLPFGKRLPQIQYFMLGWPQRSPLAMRYLDSLGMADPYQALAHRPHTYLICDKRVQVRYYTQYMSEHYAEEVPMSLVAHLADQPAAIYQAASQP